jgi:hypothetical protein
MPASRTVMLSMHESNAAEKRVLNIGHGFTRSSQPRPFPDVAMNLAFHPPTAHPSVP